MRREFINPSAIRPVPPFRFSGWWFDPANQATVSLDLLVSGKAIVGSAYMGPAIGTCSGPGATLFRVSGHIFTKSTSVLMLSSSEALGSRATLTATVHLAHSPGRLALVLDLADGTRFVMAPSSVSVVHSVDAASENCAGS